MSSSKVTGDIPVTSLFDHGCQLQLSKMLTTETLQASVIGSHIFGEYESPSEIGVGVNWFPLRTKRFRINGEFTHLDRSPIGYSSMLLAVGSKGVIFNCNAELVF